MQLTTDRQISALKAGDRVFEIRVAASRGLGVRVFPSGAKQFEFRYVATSGARRRLVMGSYPDLSLSDARARAGVLRVSIQDGKDPVAERAGARERARSGETLDELAEAYWKAAVVGLHGGRRRPKREVTISNERQTWKNHIRKPLGSRSFTEIARSDIKIFMRDLVTASGLSAASVATVGAHLHAVFGFAVQEEWLEANPVLGLARPLALTSRDRMFDDDGLRIIWDVAALATKQRMPGEKTAGIHARLDPVMGLAIQTLMLTLTRRNEVAGALKTEFDLKAGLWLIPAERAKAKHQHVVPLTPETLKVLEAAWSLDPDSPYVFPSPRVPGEHLDAHAITRAFARTCERKTLPLGSPHDVRRSGATTLTSRYGVSRFVVGLVLGHTPNEGAAVTGVYDRHTYVPEKRDALDRWSRHLTGAAPITEVPAEAVLAADSAQNAVAEAKARAMALCARNELHQAVLSMCMDMARNPETATSHMEFLGKLGLELAATGSRAKVECWIQGFR